MKALTINGIIAATLLLTSTNCDGKKGAELPPFEYPNNVPASCVEPRHPGFDWLTVHVESSDLQVSVTVQIINSNGDVIPMSPIPVAEEVAVPYCGSIHYVPGTHLTVLVRASLTKRDPEDVLWCQIQDKYGRLYGPQQGGRGHQQVACTVTL